MADYVINKDGASYLIIFGYIPKTNIMKTCLLGLTKLLIALKDICNINSDLMTRILVVIIE